MGNIQEMFKESLGELNAGHKTCTNIQTRHNTLQHKSNAIHNDLVVNSPFCVRV